jgi:trehalose 6-phosphate phosphatase
VTERPLRRLWIFDFDGTLSPIVPDRNAAKLHPAGRALLRDLSDRHDDIVAVLSSRALSDLMFQVSVPKIFLGGGSGVEWRFPGGQRIGMGPGSKHRAESLRRSLRPLLTEFSNLPGVEVEDKYWSLAIHYRRLSPADAPAFDELLGRLVSVPLIRVLSGPCVAEVQVLKEVDKSFGIERLCRLLRYDPTRGGVLYAGDDENDAVAMRWVLARKGTAVSVGGRARVFGARAVTGPSGLARAVRRLAEGT